MLLTIRNSPVRRRQRQPLEAVRGWSRGSEPASFDRPNDPGVLDAISEAFNRKWRYEICSNDQANALWSRSQSISKKVQTKAKDKFKVSTTAIASYIDQPSHPVKVWGKGESEDLLLYQSYRVVEGVCYVLHQCRERYVLEAWVAEPKERTRQFVVLSLEVRCSACMLEEGRWMRVLIDEWNTYLEI